MFYMVDGNGDCSYARKVELAKKALGRGIIIVDSPNGINNLKMSLQERDRFIVLIIAEKDALSLTSSSSSFSAELNMKQQKKEDAHKAVVELWVSTLNEGS